MALVKTAGGRLWVNGRDVAEDVDTFRVADKHTIIDRTCIAHTRRRRADASLGDADFDLAGWLDTEGAKSLRTANDFFWQPEAADDRTCWRLRGAMQPDDTREHGVGTLVRIAGPGTLDFAPQEGRVLLNARRKQTTASQNYDALRGGRWDYGGAGYVAGSHDVFLAVAVEHRETAPGGAGVEVAVTHSSAAGGPFVEVDPGGFEVDVHAVDAPAVVTWAGTIPALRRYLGLAVNTGGSLASIDLTMTVMVFVD